MSKLVTKIHLNLICIAVIGVLITAQDIYIFSQLGPKFNLLEGPEGIKDAQLFGNMRNMVTTMITHGLIIAVIFLILSQPKYTVVVQSPEEKVNEK